MKHKCIISDLDGCLVETKMIHFKALNEALKQVSNYEISLEDHLKIYDGLPTNKKLKILEEKGFIKSCDISLIKSIKQDKTQDLLFSEIKFNQEIYNLFKFA